MTRPPIDGLITFLRTRDLEANTHFYRDVLGMDLVIDQETCRIYRATETGYLGFCGDGGAQVEPTEAVIFTLVTDEVDDWHDHLTRHGIATDGAPRTNEKYLIHHFFAKDPDGYRVEVQQFRDPRWPGVSR